MYFLAQSSEFSTLIDSGTFIPVLAIALGCSVAMIAIIAGTVSKISVNKAREESRRELAAYVAEGTISPDDAVAMMNAGKSGCGISSKNAMRV